MAKSPAGSGRSARDRPAASSDAPQEFKNVAEFGAWAEEHFGRESAWYGQILKNTYGITVYAGGESGPWEPWGRQVAYREINPFLRGQHPAPAGFEAQMNDIIQSIDFALDKGRIPNNIVMYRGVTEPFAKTLAKSGIGTVFRDQAYVSTTANRAVAERYAAEGGAILRVKIPKGAKGASPDVISYTGFNAQVVLPRNQSFRIDQITQRDGQTIIDVSYLQ